MLIELYLTYPTTETANFESLFPKNGSDEFHRKWASEMSAVRKQFYDLAKQSRSGLNPVKETWKESYKQFYGYLTKTFDIVAIC
jgi:hypothetical protein